MTRSALTVLRCIFLFGGSGLSGDYELAGLIEPIQHYGRFRSGSRCSAGKRENHEVLAIRRNIIRRERSSHF